MQLISQSYTMLCLIRSRLFPDLGKSIYTLKLNSYSERLRRINKGLPSEIIQTVAYSIIMSSNSETTTPVIGTHSGSFHCDDALACFMLRLLPEYTEARILRSRDKVLLQKECSVIVDVGEEFDHERKYYDHHQRSFKETLSSLRPEFEGFNIRYIILSISSSLFIHPSIK